MRHIGKSNVGDMQPDVTSRTNDATLRMRDVTAENYVTRCHEKK